MKKITQILSIGVLLLFACTMQLNAQKCKFDYEKKDPLTGNLTRKSTFTIIATVPFYTIDKPMIWKLYFNRIGDTYFISMFFDLAGNTRDIITPENTIVFKLANGKVITLSAKDNYVPSAHIVQDTYVVSLYESQYEISEEDMRILAASPLVFLRAGIGTRSYDYEFNTKKGTNFQNKANCILQ